jgi:predicted O-methyltransferase YrrM
LKIKIDNSFKKQRKSLSSSYVKNQNKIVISDAGVGSKKLGNERIVSHIYKTSSSKGKYADLLFKLVNYYQPNRILEMGTSLGFGTYHLAAGNVNGKVMSIDACANTQHIAKSSLQKLQFDNVDFFNGTFSHFFEFYTGGEFDFVFVDGHHDGNALIEYMTTLENFTHDNTIFVLDDIRWSNSMKDAWRALIKMEKYHVSIDLFRMGILIKRPQQAKEHFVINY